MSIFAASMDVVSTEEENIKERNNKWNKILEIRKMITRKLQKSSNGSLPEISKT